MKENKQREEEEEEEHVTKEDVEEDEEETKGEEEKEEEGNDDQEAEDLVKKQGILQRQPDDCTKRQTMARDEILQIEVCQLIPFQITKSSHPPLSSAWHFLQYGLRRQQSR